jgi:uncharacterized RDD family membrane protein YckC
VSLDNTAEVETPEHIRFRYHVAGPSRRAVAYLLDLLIRLVVIAVAAVIIKLAAGVSKRADGSWGLILVLIFLVEWGYYVLFETLAAGSSPGKRALSLRVVKEGGFPLGFLDSLLRNLLRAADFLPVGYVLGLLCMSGDARFRRLGDRVAGTMVVIEERPVPTAPLSLFPAAQPEELDALPHRPPLSAWERDTLEIFLRRTALSPARRVELAQMIAPLLARRMGVKLHDPVRFLALLHHRSAARSTAAGGGGRR